MRVGYSARHAVTSQPCGAVAHVGRTPRFDVVRLERERRPRAEPINAEVRRMRNQEKPNGIRVLPPRIQIALNRRQGLSVCRSVPTASRIVTINRPRGGTSNGGSVWARSLLRHIRAKRKIPSIAFGAFVG
jgi:hypothetical protein